MNRTGKRPNTVRRRPKRWHDWDRDIARLARGDGASLGALEELASLGMASLAGPDVSGTRGRNIGHGRALFRGRTRRLPAYAINASR
jgi:hypothetical protein